MKILLKDSDLFFQKHKEKFRKDIVQALVLSIIFSFLTTVTIWAGWTTVSLTMGFGEMFAALLGSAVAGIFIIAFFLTLISTRNITIQGFKGAFFIIAYAATPALLIGWIPHGIVKLIVIIWSLIFITVGLQVKEKKSQKEAIIMAIILIIILALLTLVSENFLISPL